MKKILVIGNKTEDMTLSGSPGEEYELLRVEDAEQAIDLIRRDSGDISAVLLESTATCSRHTDDRSAGDKACPGGVTSGDERSCVRGGRNYPKGIDESRCIETVLPVALAAMMEASADCAFVKDKNLRYICCSDSFARLVEKGNAENIIGKCDAELFDQHIAEAFSRADAKVLADGKAMTDIEDMLPSRGEAWHWYSTSKYPLMSTGGCAVGIYGVTKDVTQLKEASFELDTLLNCIPSGVMKYSADEKEEFAYISRSFIERLGYTEKEFREKIGNCFQNMVYSEDRERANYEIHTQEVDGQIGKFDYRIEAADGSLRWFHDEGVKIADQEGKTWYYVTLVDITDRKNMEQQLRTSELEYRVATEQSDAYICRYDINEKTLTVSPSTMARFDIPATIYDVPESRIESSDLAADTLEAYKSFFYKMLRGEKEGIVRYQRRIRKEWRWLEARFTDLFSDDGKPVSAIITFRDVTEETEREAVYKKWTQSIDARPSESYTLFLSNLNKNLAYENRQGELLTGLTEDKQKGFNEMTRRFAEKHVAKEDRSRFIATVNSDSMLASYYRGWRSNAFDFREILKDGSYCWRRCTLELVQNPSSYDIMAYMLFEDIDEAKRQELKTRQRANTDPLTGVLNREAFSEGVNGSLSARHRDEQNALLMLDIDGFKKINDTLGHTEGDEVLVAFANTISTLVRRVDMVGRIGGDEFVVFLRDIGDKSVAIRKAETILKNAYRKLGEGLTVSVSIGIAISPENGDSFDVLYRHADAAMYRVKESGRNSYGLYKSELDDGAVSAERETK